MKRETIEQQAKSYTLAVFDELDDFSDVTQAYIDGAEWMQEIMIEKACEWMMNFKNAAGEFPLYDYVGNFRKAMEEYMGSVPQYSRIE